MQNTVFSAKHRVKVLAMTDAELIKQMGGPTQLAKQLGYGKGGTQRVQNWITRGIPASVKLKHLDLFTNVKTSQQINKV